MQVNFKRKPKSLLILSQEIYAKKILGNFEFKDFYQDFTKFIEESVFYFDNYLFINYYKLDKVKHYIKLLEEKLGHENFIIESLKQRVLLILAKQILNTDGSNKVAQIIEDFVKKISHPTWAKQLHKKINRLKKFQQLLNDRFNDYINVNNLISNSINQQYSYEVSHSCSTMLWGPTWGRSIDNPLELIDFAEVLEYWTPFFSSICKNTKNLNAAKAILNIVDLKTRQQIIKAKTKDNKTCLSVMLDKHRPSVDGLRLVLEAADEETKRFIIKSKYESKNILMLAIEHVNHLKLLNVIFEFIDESTKTELLNERDNANRTPLDIFHQFNDLVFKYSSKNERRNQSETLKLLEKKSG